LQHEYGVKLMPFDQLKPADAVILSVAHKDYLRGGWPMISRLLADGKGLVLDVRGKLDRSKQPAGVELWRM
jgi:UDP-N-acetyl-D-galactosamine dehydrogenase